MIQKIILIDDCYPINSRNTRILSSIHDSFPDSEIHVLCWDRQHKFAASSEPWTYHLFLQLAQYGNKLQKFFGLFGFRRFCRQNIRTIQPTCIIASHWNNLLMLPRLDWEKTKLIYENLDAPTGPWIARQTLHWMELAYMKHAALTVHASRFYSQLYPKKYPQLVLENKTTHPVMPINYTVHQPLRIAFLGNIRYLPILQNLVDSVRNDQRFNLTFYGSGPDYSKLVDYIGNANNIYCTGAYNYSDISNLYAKTDLIWAAYPNQDFNVKYAISNKFHESIAFAIPAIYSEKTYLADFAVQNKIGLSVDPYSANKIANLLNNIANNTNILFTYHQKLLQWAKNDTTWMQDIQPLLQIL